MSHPAGSPRIGALLAALLPLLTVFGPISMDLYLPVLPALTSELDAVASVAQLTVTACLIGLALGQIVAGPLSDRFGRRGPLLIGVAAYVLVTVLCALSPTIELLILARFVQGLAGAVGIVIAQAAGRDLYEGSALVRYYGRITVLGGVAAVLGPLLGGQLARLTDWRGLFLFLAALGLMILLTSLAIFRETLPRASRSSGGLRQTGQDIRRLLSDRVFLGAVLIMGFVNAALFAYLSGATYILQGIYGLSPQGYSLAFGLNSAGFVLLGYVGGRAAARWRLRAALSVGIALCSAGALGLLATGLWGLPLPAVLLSLFVMVSGVAFSSPPTTSLALSGYPQFAGTASSLLGLTRFAFGGLAAPLVGLGGADTVLPLGLVTVSAAALAMLARLILVGRERGTADAPSAS
jgi:DHA1 family bicyclomycin/chloramphenicol resistance-like MFS transporter